MNYEYVVKIFPMKELEAEGIVVDPERNIAYACRPDGACEIHDVGEEQVEGLARLFNKMGKDGWELVQLFFRPLGIVSFWKRVAREG